jgi:hypothetical protein
LSLLLPFDSRRHYKAAIALAILPASARRSGDPLYAADTPALMLTLTTALSTSIAELLLPTRCYQCCVALHDTAGPSFDAACDAAKQRKTAVLYAGAELMPRCARR